MSFYSVLYSENTKIEQATRRWFPKKVNKVLIEGGVPKKGQGKNVLEAPCRSLGAGGALPTGRP